MSSFTRGFSYVKRALAKCYEAASVTPKLVVVAPPTSVIRGLHSSASPLQPHATSLLQHGASPSLQSPEMAAAKPYSEIPKNKTFLGLNWEFMKDPTQAAQFFRKLGDSLGPIVRLVGAPGLPEMVMVLDPKDTEAVFRAADNTYPQRFPIQEWIDARKELNQPIGLFLE